MKREPVTKEEFEQYLKDYPRPLERDVAFMAEPPWVSYNDFTLASGWPDSVVASHSFEDRVGHVKTRFEVWKDVK